MDIETEKTPNKYALCVLPIFKQKRLKTAYFYDWKHCRTRASLFQALGSWERKKREREKK